MGRYPDITLLELAVDVAVELGYLFNHETPTARYCSLEKSPLSWNIGYARKYQRDFADHRVQRRSSFRMWWKKPITKETDAR
jgi:hypothetical protein